MRITNADVEFASRLGIDLEPGLTETEFRLMKANIELESANETIAGLQRAYDFMRAQRDRWNRRFICAVTVTVAVFAVAAICCMVIQFQ